MFVRVRAYYNRETRYTPTSRIQIVGSVTAEFSELPRDEEICTAVFGLLNDGQISTSRQALLSPLTVRYHRERLRSMRPGDLITITTADGTRHYAVREGGFQRVDRERTMV